MTIKNSLLIDNSFFLEFWAKAMDTTNYLQNWLPTKNQRGKLIPGKARTKKKASHQPH